ncbi:hypothetical protein ACKGJN_12555 [Gillisia sp. Q332]|uniref:hypothetical protein n=1 Tax=Gillisia xinjiangensis TaxID=3384765 RepID=UPI00391A0798
MDPLIETMELNFTTLKFYKDFVVSKIKEDVVLDKNNTEALVEACSGIYQGERFIYISQRFNSYNVDPLIYVDLEKATNLWGIAIVSTKASALKMAFFEKNFAKFPFEIFTEFEESLTWAKEILRKEKFS